MRRFLPILLAFLLSPLSAIAAGFHLTDSGWNCRGFIGCNGTTPPPNIASYLTAKVIALVFPTGGGLGFLFYLTVLVFMYGGFQMVYSRGEEGKETGKKAMQYGATGFVLALLVAGIMRFFCDYIYALGNGVISFGATQCQIWWP